MQSWLHSHWAQTTFRMSFLIIMITIVALPVFVLVTPIHNYLDHHAASPITIAIFSALGLGIVAGWTLLSLGMFLDAVTSLRLSGHVRLLWCVGMIAINFPVSLVYYWICYRRIELVDSSFTSAVGSPLRGRLR
jgi:hypothetical protein